MAIFSQARTSVITVPKKIVRIWMEAEHWCSEGIRYERPLEGKPFLSAVRCIEELIGTGKEVCPVAGVGVVVEHEKSFVWLNLSPSVPFVARLPDGVIS